MISKLALRAALLAAAAPIAILAPQPAAAQTGETAIRYDLPPQALNDTLRTLARLSGREILFADDAVRDRRAPALRGAMTLEQALHIALSGTGLVAEQREGAVLIRSQAAGNDDGTTSTEPMAREVTITGTRIRGTDSPSPMIVTTRASLEEAGISDLVGFSRVLPQNFAGGQNPGVAGGGDQGGQSNINNSTTLNLRGLGPDATLTLVNGHRLAYDALIQGVDISAIPLAAVERVEVIADGASALYGSDAVGGVVNLVLRRDYDGLQTSARFGASTEGGNVQQQYGGLSGARWASGGFMIAADYSSNTPIDAVDRTYTRTLNGSQTLIAQQAQLSAVVAGHQRLSEGLTFELDAQFADRRMRKANAFLATTDASINGLVNRPVVRSFAVTPVLRLALPARWEASFEATHAGSRTDIHSRRFIGGAETPQRLIYENRLTNIEAGAEGPLIALPGGDARLAIGGGYRTFALDIDTSQTVNGVVRVTRDATERRESLFAYGEMSLPLIGPGNRLPLIEALRLSVALRYERYAGIDEVVTPKLGLIYTPHRDVTLKLSWGKSFKIPTLNQVNQIRDGALFLSSRFTPQPMPPLAAGTTVLLLTGGNPDLAAERATTWTASLELRPVVGLRVEFSWFDVDYRGRIASPVADFFAALANPAYAQFITFKPSASQVSELVAKLPLGLSNQSGQTFDPAQVAAIIDTTLRNTARERVHGVDISAEYMIDRGANRLLLTAAASRIDADRQLSAGQAVLERAGLIFTPPHWRARGGASWERDGVQLSASINYAGGTRDDRFTTPGRVGAFTTLDLSARVRTTTQAGPFRNLEVRLSALNLFNAEPDRIRTSSAAQIPFDSTNQSPLGRFVSLTVAKSW